MNRREILDLLEAYHPLPEEMAKLGAIVRAAPDPMEAAWDACRVLWAQYPHLWFALERDFVERGALYTALTRAFDWPDPWAAFKELLTPWRSGPTDEHPLPPKQEAAGRSLPPLDRPPRLKPPALLLHSVEGTAEPTFEAVHVAELAATAGSVLHAENVGMISLDPMHDLADIIAAVRLMRQVVARKGSGAHPDWDLLLQLYAERRRYPSLSDTRFCADMLAGWKGIAAWPAPPADLRTVQRALKRALQLFERLTPDKSLQELMAEVR
jgi:hypothetical protein